MIENGEKLIKQLFELLTVAASTLSLKYSKLIIGKGKMGNNAAYTVFEETVIKAYDAGQLCEELLSTLMEPYRATDIDSGGSRGLLTNDGKDIETVVIETMGLTPPPKPIDENDDYEREEYYERKYDIFRSITERFDWR